MGRSCALWAWLYTRHFPLRTRGSTRVLHMCALTGVRKVTEYPTTPQIYIRIPKIYTEHEETNYTSSSAAHKSFIGSGGTCWYMFSLELLTNKFDPIRVSQALRKYGKNQRNRVYQDYRKHLWFEVCVHLFSIRKILFKRHCHIYLSMT